MITQYEHFRKVFSFFASSKVFNKTQWPNLIQVAFSRSFPFKVVHRCLIGKAILLQDVCNNQHIQYTTFQTLVCEYKKNDNSYILQKSLWKIFRKMRCFLNLCNSRQRRRGYLKNRRFAKRLL